MIMVADDGFMCRHCTTGGRFLHWLGYRDRNGVAVSEVKSISSLLILLPSLLNIFLFLLILSLIVQAHVLVLSSYAG